MTRIVPLAVVVVFMATMSGCTHLPTTQLHFDQSMSLVDGSPTPVKIDFPAPSDNAITIELVDGTRIAGTIHLRQPTGTSPYASVPVSLDFKTLSDLKDYRGTSTVVIWEPEEFGVSPYSIHLEKGQSPESLAQSTGSILAVLYLRRME